MKHKIAWWTGGHYPKGHLEEERKEEELVSGNFVSE